MPNAWVPIDWRAAADAELLRDLPPRARVAAEIALLLALVFPVSEATGSVALTVAIAVAELGLALALVRPWSAIHGRIPRRIATALVVALAVLGPLAVGRPLSGPARRLGVTLANADGGARVESVAPGMPATNVLAKDDVITAIDGVALDRVDPTADLQERVRNDATPEDVTITVARAGATLALPVHVPRASARSRLGARLFGLSTWTQRHVVASAAIRDGLLALLLFALVRAGGQRVTSLGLVRAGLRRELVPAGLAILGAFGVQIAAGILIAIAAVALGGTSAIEHEGTARAGTIGHLATQASLPELLVSLIVASSFEELAFRAFLVPRARSLTGSWVVAALLVNAAFGLGHAYEGTFAMLQTALLGGYFTIVFLWRRRLFAPVASHVAFNTVMLIAAYLVAVAKR